jgi:predicted GTPase
MTEQLSDVSELTSEQREWIQREFKAESSKPLSVAIMGQTGVGKSSLLNALFGTHLAVGDVRPTTKLPEPVTVAGSTGHPMIFWDMPGIGESVEADESYLSMYRQKLIDSDVVLWAIHADSRSTAFDAAALEKIMSGTSASGGRALSAKITFVLTKADLLTPPPWIYYRDGNSGCFAPSTSIRQRLAEKARYYQEVLIRPYGGLALTETYNAESFRIDDPRFSWDEHRVRYAGFMSEEMCDHFGQQHPEFIAVFERLADNHRIIPCSSQFRYNLIRLMVVIVNKLGENAIGRFQQLVGDTSQLDQVPVRAMTKLGNLVVWDKQKSRVTFDLDEIKL